MNDMKGFANVVLLMVEREFNEKYLDPLDLEEKFLFDISYDFLRVTISKYTWHYNSGDEEKYTIEISMGHLKREKYDYDTFVKLKKDFVNVLKENLFNYYNDCHREMLINFMHKIMNDYDLKTIKCVGPRSATEQNFLITQKDESCN